MFNFYTIEKLILTASLLLSLFFFLPARADSTSCSKIFTDYASNTELLSARELDQLVDSLVTQRGVWRGLDKLDKDLVLHRISDIDKKLIKFQLTEMSSYFNRTFNLKTAPKSVLDTRSQISKSNLQRISNKSFLKNSSSRFKTLKKIIETKLRTDFSKFTHQTSSPESQVQTFWFSSQQLQEMGFGAGLQSDLRFNRDFLKTQNWIFFSMSPLYDYGTNSKNVKFDYVQKIGFMSPFVMHVSDLIEFGVSARPDLLKSLQEEIETKYPEVWSEALDKVRQDGHSPHSHRGKQLLFRNAVHFTLMMTDLNEPKILKKFARLFKLLKEEQAHYVFTPEDYLTLSTEVLAAYMWKNYSNESINRAQNEELKPLLAEAFDSLFLPRNYEVKVPVAMRTRHFIP